MRPDPNFANQVTALTAQIDAYRNLHGCSFQTAFDVIVNGNTVTALNTRIESCRKAQGLSFEDAHGLVLLNADMSGSDVISWAEIAPCVGCVETDSGRTVIHGLVEAIKAKALESFPILEPLTAGMDYTTAAGIPRRNLALALGLAEGATREQVLAEIVRCFEISHPEAAAQREFVARLQHIGQPPLALSASVRDEVAKLTALSAAGFTLRAGPWRKISDSI